MSLSPLAEMNHLKAIGGQSATGASDFFSPREESGPAAVRRNLVRGAPELRVDGGLLWATGDPARLRPAR